MDRDESAVLRGCQVVGVGLVPSWERWAGKGPEAAGNSQPSPRRSICGGHSRPPLKPSPCQAPGCLPFPATRRGGNWQRCQELKKTNHLGVTHPGRQGLSAPHLTQRVRSCVSLFLPSPAADSQILQVPDLKLCGAPAMAKDDVLQFCPGLPEKALYRLSMKGRNCAGMGSQDAPSPAPLKMLQHPLRTHGSHLATPSVAQSLPTAHSWEGDGFIQKPQLFSNHTLGCDPLPPFFPHSRKKQSG